ncbi:GNAT family N-acetyltransferase [Rhodopseudomonas sp. B29]|uniref:GNAT family N-acetyltransferase n=1 Tax=Rhodopseudomonas sp. B29 TaxID=95607 RepID=UPI00068888D4|nr:GNAT family N-acetyltransferase [Rhodopseudomonas sp. B29]
MTTAPGAANLDSDRLEIVRTTERLQEIGTAWEALWTQADALVFQSHAWTAAWWGAVPDRDRRELFVVLAWHGETLQAVLPLATCRWYGVRVLEWAAKDYTDYCDGLLRPGIDRDLLRRMWDHAVRSGGFDAAYLTHVSPSAAATIFTERGTASGLRPYHRQAASLRVVGPWTSSQVWFDSHSGNARRNYRRSLKALGENAVVRFRLLPPDEPFEPALRRCAELKRAWCERNGLVAPLFDEGSPMFAALVGVLADKKLLRIFVLERDGVIVAMTVNFMQHDTMMAYVTTYDAAFERASPGTILLFDYIRWSIDHGATTIDFLCGEEDYKHRFANQRVELKSFAAGRSVLGAAALSADRAVHKVKRLRDRRMGNSKAVPAATEARQSAGRATRDS